MGPHMAPVFLLPVYSKWSMVVVSTHIKIATNKLGL